MLRARLRWLAQAAETAAPVIGQSLEINDRLPSLPKGMQQVGFARAGATAQHQQGPGGLKTCQHPAAVGLVAAFQQQNGQLQGASQPSHAA